MRHVTLVMLVVALFIGFLAGYSINNAGVVTAQQGERPPAWSTVPLAPDQGESVHWSLADLQNAHTAMAARANGRTQLKPYDLLSLMVTPTHSVDFIHRPFREQPGIVEEHEGVTDFYVVIGGDGTAVVGGDIENRRTNERLSGEHNGTAIAGGRRVLLAAGDMLNIPPSTPHQVTPGEEGITYMLMKLNVGTYPWRLVAGLQ